MKLRRYQKHEAKLVKYFKDHASKERDCSALARRFIKENPDLQLKVDPLRKTFSEIADNTPMERDVDMDFLGFNMPESTPEDQGVYNVEGNNILLVGDLHIPYHDVTACKTAFEYGISQGVDNILINGDLIDFYQVSRFHKDPSRKNIKFEIDVTRKFWENLRKIYKGRLDYNEGNHDLRLGVYIQSKAPQLSEFEETRLEFLLKLKEYDVNYIPNKSTLKIGKLRGMHGHEIFMGAGVVNVAKTLLDKTGTNTFTHHFHRTNEFVKKLMNDEIISGWSVGCLCQLNPYYMPINQWNHGLARIEKHSDDTFVFHNHKIYNGKLY